MCHPLAPELAAGAAGALLRMPVTPPEANRSERQTEVTLAPDGSITATMHARRFDVDEIPEATKLESAFGTYSASYEDKDGVLVFTRASTQRAATVPAADYAIVRDFYGRIRATEEAPVVLAKK